MMTRPRIVDACSICAFASMPIRKAGPCEGTTRTIRHHGHRCGNAGLCAAAAAAETGPLSVLTGSYGEDAYFEDLKLVTRGLTDETLARLAIRSSQKCLPWMESQGVRFQPAPRRDLHLTQPR